MVPPSSWPDAHRALILPSVVLVEPIGHALANPRAEVHLDDALAPCEEAVTAQGQDLRRRGAGLEPPERAAVKTRAAYRSRRGRVPAEARCRGPRRGYAFRTSCSRAMRGTAEHHRAGGPPASVWRSVPCCGYRGSGRPPLVRAQRALDAEPPGVAQRRPGRGRVRDTEKPAAGRGKPRRMNWPRCLLACPPRGRQSRPPRDGRRRPGAARRARGWRSYGLVGAGARLGITDQNHDAHRQLRSRG